MRRGLCGLLAIILTLGCFTPAFGASGEHIIASEEFDELIQFADLSTDIPIRPGSYLDNIRDAMYGSRLYGKDFFSDYIKPEDAKYPYYIEFDFKEKEVMLAYMVLYTTYADTTGITNFSIEYQKDGKWETALKGGGENYNNSLNRVINVDSRPVSTKFRFVINEARNKADFFRIWEMEIYGRVVGFSDISEIKAVKPNYYRIRAGEEMPKPDSAVIIDADGTEKKLQAVFGDMPKEEKEGLYRAEGKLLWTENPAELIVDVYNENKVVGGMVGHWSERNIRFAVENGWLGGVERSAADGISRTDAAKIIWRALNLDLNPLDEGFSDTEKNSPEYRITAALNRCGMYGGIVPDKLSPSKPVTRLEAVRYITNIKKADSRLSVSFKDITDMEREILEKAYALGIIADGDSFYPDRAVSLAEFVSMLCRLDGDIYAVRNFTDTKEPLANPDMGMFSYMVDSGGLVYDAVNGPDENFEDIPGVSAVYVRTLWSQFNPAEDVYDFGLIDGLIEKYSKLGKQIAIRVQSFEGYEWSAPKWVYDYGAKQLRWDYSTPPRRFEEYNDDPDVWYAAPDYDDPIFTKYETEFYEEFGRRYNGNPNIAFIDMGVGLWGEGHTGGRTPSFSMDAIIYRMELLKRVFPDTQVVIVNELEKGVGEDRLKWEEIMDKAAQLGIGYRNDTYYGTIEAHGSYMFQSIERRDAARMSEYGPVVMELDHYKTVKSLGQFGEDGIGIGKTIKPHHASFMGMHGHLYEMWEQNPKFFEYCYMNLGYRIMPERTAISATSDRKKITVCADWKNTAACKPYRDYYPALTLADENGNTVLTQVDTGFSIKNLETAPIAGDSTVADDKNCGIVPVTSWEKDFYVTGVPAGRYKAYISLGTIDGEAKLYMPITGHDGNKKYYIGEVEIKK